MYFFVGVFTFIIINDNLDKIIPKIIGYKIRITKKRLILFITESNLANLNSSLSLRAISLATKDLDLIKHKE